MLKRIVNNSPDSINGIELDKSYLKNDLDINDYASVLERDGELCASEIIEKYGIKYVVNDVWVSVIEGKEIRVKLTAHEILENMFFHPNQYEGISSFIISGYLGVFSSVAGGQGGGMMLIDIETGHCVFKTKEFSIQYITWIPTHKVFICLNDVATYAWHQISLVIITLSGKVGWVKLYAHDHLIDKSKYEPGKFPVMEKISSSGLDMGDRPKIGYNSLDDTLYLNIYGQWVCDFKDIIKSANISQEEVR